MALILVTVKEAAEHFNVHRATIYRWIKQGDIPCIERRGKYIFNPSTIETWAASKHILLKSKPLYETSLDNKLIPNSSALLDAIQLGKVFKNSVSLITNFGCEKEPIKFFPKEEFIPVLPPIEAST